MPSPDQQRPNQDPFFGAAFDPKIDVAATFLLEAASGISVENPDLKQKWQECLLQINALGPDHGKNVLEVLNLLAIKRNGLSLMLVEASISAYCKMYQIQIPQIPKSP